MNVKKTIVKIFSISFLTILFYSCGTTANTTVSKLDGSLNAEVKEAPYTGLKRVVAIARFSNETEYAKGAFYDKENDPLGNQAQDILSAKLAARGKFILLERAESDKIQAEFEKKGAGQSGMAADYLIIGSLTEFGRKTTGEVGVFTRSKTQTVEAGVNLRLVDVATGQIIYSEEGKGQAETSSSTTLGFGGVQGYDETLSDKAISAAIEKLVDNIEKTCMDRPWQSVFLSYDNDAVIIAGGKKQNLSAGKVLAVYERGKKVKNPQTGAIVELPGTKVAEVTVVSTGGTTIADEYSIVNLTNGSVNASKLSNYIITEF